VRIIRCLYPLFINLLTYCVLLSFNGVVIVCFVMNSCLMALLLTRLLKNMHTAILT